MSKPSYRFWGSRKPPMDRSKIWNVSTPTAADDATKSGKVATLRMYGPIDSYGGWWGISAKDVSAALDELDDDVNEIHLRINSPGGEVWEGMAILNMLRAHRAKVVAVVDGIAASAASVIATGCDETVMSPGTQFMVHDASTYTWGQAKDLRKEAEALDSVSNSIAAIYAESAGGTAEEWRAVMVEETWYTATEAVESGLAERVAVVMDEGETTTAGDDPVVLDDVEDLFDLSIFNHAGRSKAPAPKPPTASADGTTHTEGGSAVAFTTEQITMRQKLGIPEDADEATTLAALTEALEEQVETTPPTNVVPDGHVVIPAAKLADLEGAAALATATAKTLHEQERTAFLDSVKGKYLPTSRAGWEKEYDLDPAATKAHFETAPVIIPTSEIGHDNPVGEAKTEDDKAFAGLTDAQLEAYAAQMGLNKEDLRG